MIKFDINKKEYAIDFAANSIECTALKSTSTFQFNDIKEMTLFVNKFSDLLEKELNNRDEKNKSEGK